MPPPAYALPRTELHVLSSRATGREYQLHVSLPRSYASAPERTYPLVCLPDPQWDFAMVAAILGNLLVDGAAPECVVVGVGYPGEDPDYDALRVHDLAPAFDGAGRRESAGRGAAGFLGALEREILPFVERTWRVQPGRRVLVGSSLGGLFALYALLERPGLFHGVVAVSPAVNWADDWLFGVEERVAAASRTLPGRLFMSGAEREWPDYLAAIRRFDARLRERAHDGLAYAWRLVEGEAHAGTKAESFNRGLRFVFAG